MADQIAKLNQLVSWTPAATEDTLTCSDISPGIRSGIQIDVDGFDLSSATVTAVNSVGGTIALSTTGMGKTAILGEGFAVSSIVITGLAAGTYPVRIGQ